MTPASDDANDSGTSVGTRDEAREAGTARFVVRRRPMGVKPALNYDRISALIEAVEGADHH